MITFKKSSDIIFKSIVFFFTMITIISVIFIGVFMFYSGGPSIMKVGLFKFLFGTTWDSGAAPPQYGILMFILSSIYVAFCTIIIAVPLSLMVALGIGQFLAKKPAAVLRGIINMLAGIPSVIYGFVGAIILVPAIQEMFDLPAGLTMLAAIVVLIIMTLPTIISVSETSINAVPETYMEASLALGVRKEYTLFKIVIPAAKSGIMTAVLLGMGRAIGETMAVMMVSGNVSQMPGMLKPVRFLTTAIVTEMSYASEETRGVLFGIGLVLFVFIFAVNAIFRYFIKRAGEVNG